MSEGDGGDGGYGGYGGDGGDTGHGGAFGGHDAGFDFGHGGAFGSHHGGFGFDDGADQHGHSFNDYLGQALISDALFGLAPGLHGAGHSFTDYVTLALAYDVVHGDHAEHYAPGISSVGDGPPAVGHAHGQHVVDGPTPLGGVNISGIATDDQRVQVLVWPHGQCDPRAEFRAIAERLGLIRLVGHPLNIPSRYEKAKTLLNSMPWFGPNVTADKPNGYYPGACGETEVWTEPWQIAKQPAWWAIWESPGPDPANFHTCLVVLGATWHYRKPDDYETKLLLSVYSTPYVEGGVWVPHRAHIQAHRAKAEQIGRELVQALQQHPVSDAAKQFRAQRAQAGGQASTGT